MSFVAEHADVLGIAAACEAVALPRATFYRHQQPQKPPTPRPSPPRALSADERREALEVLHEPRFVDKAPAEVYATLLDEGRYLCSVRTMYRILAEDGEVRERRNVLRHANHPRPELLAAGPREVWSWDISVPQKRRRR